MNSRNAGIIRANNTSIMNAIRNSASLSYQQRIPAATQANISETLENLQHFRPAWNEFIDALVNRIGSIVAQNMVWENPLSEFKEAKLSYGATIQEIQVGLIESKTYSAQRDYLERELFGNHPIEAKSLFHSVNRQEYYPITVNEAELSKAFLEEGGLSNFIQMIMSAPITSDNFDEFLLMTSLFKEYESNGGFYHVRVPDINTLSASEADSRQVLKVIQALSGALKFPSRAYNPAKMPTFSNPEDLVLFITPEAKANIDIEGLAPIFHLDKANVSARIIDVPKEYFGIDGCQGILTTRGFFKVADTRVENTSQPNPVGLTTNYFLHHWQIISASLFVPAIMLHTSKNDEVVTIKPSNVTISSLDVFNIEGEDMPSKVVPGSNYVAKVELGGENVDKFQIGIDYDIVGNSSSRTVITNEGVLNIGIDEKSATITVKATVTYVPADNPQSEPSTQSKEVTVEVEKALSLWPKKD